MIFAYSSYHFAVSVQYIIYQAYNILIQKHVYSKKKIKLITSYVCGVRCFHELCVLCANFTYFTEDKTTIKIPVVYKVIVFAKHVSSSRPRKLVVVVAGRRLMMAIGDGKSLSLLLT